MVHVYAPFTGMSLPEGYSLFVAEALSHTRHREHIPSRICLPYASFSSAWNNTVLERAECVRRKCETCMHGKKGENDKEGRSPQDVRSASRGVTYALLVLDECSPRIRKPVSSRELDVSLSTISLRVSC